jgi:hypothetical protein
MCLVGSCCGRKRDVWLTENDNTPMSPGQSVLEGFNIRNETDYPQMLPPADVLVLRLKIDDFGSRAALYPPLAEFSFPGCRYFLFVLHCRI